MKNKAGIVSLFLASGLASSAQAFDLDTCRAVAGKFHGNPFGMTIGELDTMRLCGADMLRLRQNQEREAQEQRRFEREIERDYGQPARGVKNG